MIGCLIDQTQVIKQKKIKEIESKRIRQSNPTIRFTPNMARDKTKYLTTPNPKEINNLHQ